MANFTGDGNFTYKPDPVLSQPQAGILTFISALNFFLSVTASLGNALILIALRKVSSIHPPTKLFFRCLAVSDLCVGIIVQPLHAADTISDIKYIHVNVFYYIAKVVWALSMLLCGVSVLTSTAISVDRLLALLLGLRYKHVVTLRRVRFVITCFWLICTSAGTIRLWSQGIATRLTSFAFALSVVISIYCYTRIHLKLRCQQDQVQNQVNQGELRGRNSQMNKASYRRTVSTIFWVQLALVACYIPWAIMIVLHENGIRSYLVRKAAVTLVLLNSSLNPILYCWKITEVKQAAKDTIKQLNYF